MKFWVQTLHRALVLHIDLQSGQHGLLALKEDLATVKTERGTPKGGGETGGHELGAPAPLTGHAVRVLVGLEQIALLASAAGMRGAILADDGFHTTLVVFKADETGCHFGYLTACDMRPQFFMGLNPLSPNVIDVMSSVSEPY